MSNHPHDEDLLRLVDRELDAARSGDIERHLEDCSECMVRYRVLTNTSSEAAGLWHNGWRVADSIAAREHLHQTMADTTARRHARWAPIAMTLSAVLLFLTARYESALVGQAMNAKALERQALPVASITPGAARPVSVQDVCLGRRRIAPPIPEATRRQVLRDYGMEHVPDNEYELDYLITPELGGIADRRNLWPELYGSQSWNAYVKDALEHALPRLVCRGDIDLATAQRQMATNWIAAYRKYLSTERPVELHARVLIPSPRPDW
jgi:hypothetical protein